MDRRDTMIDAAPPIGFRGYQAADFDAVASLWTRTNRELAPIGMEKIFEQYIAMTIDGELKQLVEIFSETKRSAFWVVECQDKQNRRDKIVGSFGIESRSVSETELRGMYLDQDYRGLGIAQRSSIVPNKSADAVFHKDHREHRANPESS
jgi:RimJ/RimL family protein N-acetyltransferase